MTTPGHRARITWSAAQAAKGLPAVTETIDPAWFADDTPATDQGWSLICRFERSPLEQGNPSPATIRFLVPDAPHDRLGAGVVLQMFERGTRQYATVELID